MRLSEYAPYAPRSVSSRRAQHLEGRGPARRRPGRLRTLCRAAEGRGVGADPPLHYRPAQWHSSWQGSRPSRMSGLGDSETEGWDPSGLEPVTRSSCWGRRGH